MANQLGIRVMNLENGVTYVLLNPTQFDPIFYKRAQEGIDFLRCSDTEKYDESKVISDTMMAIEL